MTQKEIDLGCDHFLTFSCWKPDRALNPRYDHLPDVEKYGALVRHKTPNGKECNGYIHFDGPVQRELGPHGPFWVVECWDPLTLSPSLLCECGDHGFIRNGHWEKA